MGEIQKRKLHLCMQHILSRSWISSVCFIMVSNKLGYQSFLFLEMWCKFEINQLDMLAICCFVKCLLYLKHVTVTLTQHIFNKVKYCSSRAKWNRNINVTRCRSLYNIASMFFFFLWNSFVDKAPVFTHWYLFR